MQSPLMAQTTLLNLIGSRYTSGTVKGYRAFNNQRLSKATVKKYGGYVMQGTTNNDTSCSFALVHSTPQCRANSSSSRPQMMSCSRT